jgi:hypothetical protein
MPQLAGTGDLEKPGPPALGLVRAALDQPPLAHHPQHALAVDRLAQLARHPGGDEPVAVGRVALGDLDDRSFDVVDRRAPCSVRRLAMPGNPIDSLAADSQDARHDRRAMPASDELTGVGDAQRHSHVRKPFPRISSS